MRRNHMDLLTHQRDDTVLQGIRENPFSLTGCVNCHARREPSGQPIRVDVRGQFCQSCHEFTAVSIDCFSCHSALPEATGADPSRDTRNDATQHTHD